MRFVTTNDFNSMIKASVNFTHNYQQNRLFDIKFNISHIEFEELSQEKIKSALKDNTYKNNIYNYETNSIYDNDIQQGFIILSKKYFDFDFYNKSKTNDYINNNTNLIFLNDENIVRYNDHNNNENSKENVQNFNEVKSKNDNDNPQKNFNLIFHEKKKEDPNLKIVQDIGIENCFLFLNPNSAVEALNILFETNDLIHDNWNTIIFIVIILFFFFMKINIFFELLKIINKFKFDNFPNIFTVKNFYVYVIFNGTLFLILPLLYFGYDDYNFDFCLGFSDAYFNSFLADRQIFLQRQKDHFDPYQREYTGNIDENMRFKNSIFYVHDSNRNTSNIITKLGYLKNMLFLCIFVWISGMRNIFKPKKLNTKEIIPDVENEENNNKSDNHSSISTHLEQGI